MLRINDLCVDYRLGDGSLVTAVDNLNLTVEPGSLVTLLGPSGCGKSSTLRAVAGLEQPRHGRIQVGDAVVYDSAAAINVPTRHRNIGLVFQSYAIWPHLSAFENVAFPLRVGEGRRRNRVDVARKVEAALETVGLGGVGRRSPAELSGGQRQRLALARSIVQEPALLLLDEPLSNLDARLRDQMRAELKELQQRIGLTMVYVTHDQAEALALSDQIVVMEGGRIQQQGSPREVYERPANRFVAGFIGASNVLTGTVRGRDGTAVLLQTAVGVVRCERVRFPAGALPDVDVPAALVIRPEDIRLAAADTGEVGPPPSGNVCPGEVRTVLFGGTHSEVIVTLGEPAQRIRVLAPADCAFTAGDQVRVVLPADRCTCLADT